MDIYTIRLVRHPELYVGKQSPSYAIKSDKAIGEWMHYKAQPIDEVLQIDAHWYKSEQYAKIWTNKLAVKRFLAYCGEDKDATFSEYEILKNGNVINIKEIYE